MKKPVLGLTMGDPAGIGSEIIVKALLDKKMYDISRPVVFGDAKQQIIDGRIPIIDRSIKIININFFHFVWHLFLICGG